MSKEWRAHAIFYPGPRAMSPLALSTGLRVLPLACQWDNVRRAVGRRGTINLSAFRVFAIMAFHSGVGGVGSPSFFSYLNMPTRTGNLTKLGRYAHRNNNSKSCRCFYRFIKHSWDDELKEISDNVGHCSWDLCGNCVAQDVDIYNVRLFRPCHTIQVLLPCRSP